jgi:catalase (peroxidase I)
MSNPSYLEPKADGFRNHLQGASLRLPKPC